MVTRLPKTLLLCSTLVFLISCGDQSLFMSSKNSANEMQISSIADGTVLASGAAVPLTITGQESSENGDIEIDVTLTTPTGDVAWHNKAAVTLNEQTTITLPSTLAPGLYRLDYVLYSSGDVVQKKSASFFIAKDTWQIVGIKSFPLVIGSSATVMLKAELQIPANANPYLRWTWKGKSIAKGMLSDGMGQILWVVPADAGVYTVTLEMFPSAPTNGADYSFTSSLAMATDIVVSSNASANGSDLAPQSSYLSLLHMQASLSDVGVGSKRLGKTSAVAVGKPEIVVLDDGFGYQLDGSTGIQIPWFALPSDGGTLKPFTMSLGVSFDDPSAGGNVVTAASADGSLTLAITLDPVTKAPVATFIAGGSTLTVPWSGAALSAKQRYLISLSVVPLGNEVTTQWFLDGIQVSAVSASFALPSVQQAGSITIGGDKGFSGVVEEFGVYYQDASSRPATDAGLYARAEKKLNGTALVLADGFDGIFPSDGFSVKGKGQLSAGSLTLSAGSALTLPGLKLDGSPLAISLVMSKSSSRTATLAFGWEDSAQAAQTVEVKADSSGIGVSVAADGQSITVATPTGAKTITMPAPENSGMKLQVTVENPSASAASLVFTDALVLKEK